ncbi:MAG: SBBP repeat-containing protein, partial [Bacteroidales bacterium]
MKKYLSVLLAICAWQFMALNVSASNPNTGTWDAGHSTVTDINGNVYVAGYFNSSTITFGTVTLTKTNTVSSSYNMFLIKYDPAGNVLWATKAGGSGGNDQPNGIVTDGNNVYLTGICGTDPNITFFSATSSGTTITLNNAYSYLVKYDPAGNVIWAKNEIGSPEWQGIAIAGEYLYRTGSFSGTVTIGSTILTSRGGNDIFTAEYDLDGNVLWAKSAGGSGDDEGMGIAADGSGNLYVTGMFYSSSIAFGSTTLINSGLCDIFFAKYDVSGNVLWASGAGGSSYDNCWGMAGDVNGNTYITGNSLSPSITFYSATPAGPKITLTNSAGGYAGYFSVKYDPNGTLVWAKNAKGNATGDGITLYGNNVYATGSFNSSTVFGSPALKSKPSPAPAIDIFVVKYDTNGNLIWTKGAGGVSYDATQDAATDGSGNILITGYFHSSTVTFGTTTLTLGNTSDYDMFIAKYDANGNALWARSAGAPSSGHNPKSATAGI